MCTQAIMSVLLFVFECGFCRCVLVKANIQDPKEENQNEAEMFLVYKVDAGLLPISPLSQMGILKIAGEADKEGKKQ